MELSPALKRGPLALHVLWPEPQRIHGMGKRLGSPSSSHVIHYCYGKASTSTLFNTDKACLPSAFVSAHLVSTCHLRFNPWSHMFSHAFFNSKSNL